jgi:xanthine dehydrogenase YagR molybdenum-binding subunit
MTTVDVRRSVGESVTRLEGRDKVAGRARYSADIPLDQLAYGWIVSATVARGRIAELDEAGALAQPGVLAVLHHGNAPKLTFAGDHTVMVLQDDRVHHRGQAVALVVATTPEQAREAAETLRVSYEAEPHDVAFSENHPGHYTPQTVNGGGPAETHKGDVEAAIAGLSTVVDAVYRTAAQHNNPMEPHSSTAVWDGGSLTVHDANQGAFFPMRALQAVFGLPDGSVRVLSEHVGGGFGAKGAMRVHTVLAAMAARLLDRPVRVTMTRAQMYFLTGHRTPTVQRVRIGADGSGRIVALDHLAYSHTSQLFEFTEQTAATARSMYEAENLRTSHRVVKLDIPTPQWMRAPGEAPGSFGLESAVDELAHACGIDPVELRIRSEPEVEPATGIAYSSRGLVQCLREGAERFGWGGRDPRPGQRRRGRWLIGTGVAAANFPSRTIQSTATATAAADGTFTVRIAAADVGTGARTILAQIAADALGVPLDAVDMRIGDSDFGFAMLSGGSMGTASWSWAVDAACRELAQRLAEGEPVPAEGLTTRVDTADLVAARPELARHSYGAHFVEVAVDPGTGEVRVPRMLGVFAAGRIINPLTARSQMLGGMTWGLSAALHEESIVDIASGDFLNHDLANYHFAANADVGALEVVFVDEVDENLNPLGVKGIGELSIVGVAAAVANGIWHATGLRLRSIPIRPDHILAAGVSAG